MFDVDQLVSACVAATTEDEPRRVVREVLARTVSDPTAVADALRPDEGGLTMLHESDDLTVVHAVWAPQMTLYPHDHRMWAVIGIYAGREDNAFFRRSTDHPRSLTDSGGKQLDTGDVLVLGADVIHSVTNPLHRLTGAIHVYGGDFVHAPRSQWGPGPVEERPLDMDDVHRQFEEANRAWRASTS